MLSSVVKHVLWSIFARNFVPKLDTTLAAADFDQAFGVLPNIQLLCLVPVTPGVHGQLRGILHFKFGMYKVRGCTPTPPSRAGTGQLHC